VIQAEGQKYKVCLGKQQKNLFTNSSTEAKIEVRKHVLEAVGLPEPMILDCFAAGGHMWKLAWDKTNKYVGIDKDTYTDERRMIIGDNERILRQLALDEFDIFDLDAFGSPFHQLAIICNRLRWTRTDRVGIVLTDGTGFAAKCNQSDRKFLKWIGVEVHEKTMTQFHERDTLIGMGIAQGAWEARARVRDVLVMKKDKGAYMRYIGYVMEKLP
jgi:hypothetical protein